MLLLIQLLNQKMQTNSLYRRLRKRKAYGICNESAEARMEMMSTLQR
jgi:hypothetical protein